MEELKKNVEKKINEGADRLREGLDQTRSQAVNLVEKNFPNADAAIENAKARGEEFLEKAKSKGHDLLEDLENTGQRTWNQAKSFVQKRPTQALGYALLLGVVLGGLIYSKTRD
jgi:ElaB/YqjD/DUF883 family membrane-anchored ribosome-binding protein